MLVKYDAATNNYLCFFQREHGITLVGGDVDIAMATQTMEVTTDITDHHMAIIISMVCT